MRWPNFLAGGTPTKRILIRLGALGVMLPVGFIAIAQAQRLGGKKAAPEAAAAEPAAAEPAATPAASNKDPFAATRLASGPTSLPTQTPPRQDGLFNQAREAFAASTQPAAPPSTGYSEPTPAVRGQDALPAGNAADARYGDASRNRYSDPFGGNRYGQSTEAATAATTEPAAHSSDAAHDATAATTANPQEHYGSGAAQEPTPAVSDRYSNSNATAGAGAVDRLAQERSASGRYSQPPEPTPAAAMQFSSQPPATLPAHDEAAPARLPTTAGNPLRRMPGGVSSGETYNAPIGRLTSNTLVSGDEGTGKPGQAQLEGAQAPSVTIEKFAPAEVQVGKPAIFEILVRNVGQVRATGVTVQDQVPRKTRLLSTSPEAQRTADGGLIWNVGNLEPGEERIVKMEITPIDDGELGSVALVSFTAATSAKTVATRPELKLEVTAPKEVMIGGDAALVIKISNPGTGAATGIVLREVVPEHFTHPGGGELEYEVGDLKPGESRELELALRAAKPGPTANVLTARGDGSLQAKSVTELNVVAPALQVAMTGPKRRFLEREATYTVSISNPGTAAAREIELVTYLPKGLDFVRADNYGEYDPKSRAVRWSLEELPANEAGSVTLTAMPVEAGEHKVLIEGTAEKGLATKQEQVISVEGVAAILFQVVDVEDPIEVNGETTYEIRVVNQGSKAATDLQLEAVLPPQMRPLSAEGPVRHEIAGTTVLFDKLARLAPKADTTYRVRAKGLQAGDMRMRVRVMTNEITTPIVKEESTRVYADE